VETALKGKRHRDVAGIKEHVTVELLKRFNKCIQVDGNYIEQK
jgi:hypothetical protein